MMRNARDARRLEAEPDNTNYFNMVLAQRARVEGEGVYLECLSDLDTWNKSSRLIQELAASVVLSRLGPDYEFVYPKTAGLKYWECVNCPRDMPDPVPDTFKTRLSTFRHKDSLIEFQLIPGRKDQWSIHNWSIHNSHGDSPWDLFDLVNTHDEPMKFRFRSGEKVLLVTLIDANSSETINPWLLCDGPFVIERLESEAFKPFLIARSTVTNKQFRGPTDIGDEFPALGDGFHFISQALGDLEMRLPTVSEWRYACCAGTTTRFYWGDSMDDSHCWHSGNSGDDHSKCELDFFAPSDCPCGGPHPHSHKDHEDAKKWNAFGLVDMIGNVWEWCQERRIMGGSFSTTESVIRSNLDYHHMPMDCDNDFGQIGFRPVVSIPSAIM